MREFNFTTNIEKRTTDTGKVFFVNRMTSDYATAHPLDVDGFIESVYQEFAGTEFEESREVLRSVWNAVLSDMNPCGDASLYPNKNGQHRAAAMKVWHKAGDYWRAGLRIGDTLPQIAPGHKITRLPDGGWIALFPKDEHLLTTTQPVEPRTEAECRTDTTDSTDTKVAELQSEQPEPKQEPRQLNLFTMQARPQRRRRASKPAPSVAAAVAPVSPAVCIEQSDELQGLKNVGKALAIVIGLSAVLVVLWQTGLIIPFGLIGLATSGLLK